MLPAVDYLERLKWLHKIVAGEADPHFQLLEIAVEDVPVFSDDPVRAAVEKGNLLLEWAAVFEICVNNQVHYDENHVSPGSSRSVTSS